MLHHTKATAFLSLLATCLLWSGDAVALTVDGLPHLSERQKAVMLRLQSQHGTRSVMERLQTAGAKAAARRNARVQSQRMSVSLVVTERVRMKTKASASSARAYASSLRAAVSPPRLVPATSSSSSSSSSSFSSGRPFLPAGRGLQPAFVSAKVSTVRNRVIQLVNEERAAAGLSPLREHAYLDRSAQAYAEDMAAHDFFSHQDLLGHSSQDRIRATGYLDDPCGCNWKYWTGENLGKMQKTPEDVMKDWMSSPGHRANILSPDYDDIGVGWAEGYWVQHFGKISPGS